MRASGCALRTIVARARAPIAPHLSLGLRLGAARWHSSDLNPPPLGLKLNPEQPPNHEFHRHSTRYHRTSREVLEALDKNWMEQPHYVPVTWHDRVALRSVKFLRRLSDAYFKERLLDRACMLETIAAVPGFVAGMVHHMRSLRRMVHCNWIKPVMDEAENERMHLMTFMELAQQRWHQRVMVVCGQGVFFAAYTIFYVLTPRIAHRFVGYLEEEAVHTYTEMLKMVDEGKIKNVAAPKIAIKYWNMPEDATLRDVILVVPRFTTLVLCVGYPTAGLARDLGISGHSQVGGPTFGSWCRLFFRCKGRSEKMPIEDFPFEQPSFGCLLR